MTASRRLALALFAAPLTLGLAACNGGSDTEIAESDAIDPIPAPEGTSWTQVAAATEEGGVVLGNPDAPIKLIEYGSFTCSACAGFVQNSVERLKADYVSTGVVSFELRNLDRNGVDSAISNILRCGSTDAFHPLADQVWGNFDTIIQRAQAANLQGIEDLPPEQRWIAVASEAGLLDFFASRGISRDQAAACLSDAEAVEGFSNRTNALGNELGVTVTPTFFVNGVKVEGADWNELEGVLQRAGARPAE